MSPATAESFRYLGSRNNPEIIDFSSVLNSQDFRSQYRTKLAKALWLASRYHGTEKEYKELMQVLVDLEEWRRILGGDLDAPLVLISTKHDLEPCADPKVVKEIQSLINAESLFETSSFSGLNVQKAFQKISKLALENLF